MQELLYLLLGLFIGGVSAWFIRTFQLKASGGLTSEAAERLERELSEARSERDRLIERASGLTGSLEQLTSDYKNLQAKYADAGSETATLRERNESLREKIENQKTELEQIQERFKAEFENLANKILEDKSKKFTEQNRENLDLLLGPLGEKLKDFSKKVEDTYNTEKEERITLRTQIEHLTKLNEQMSTEANNLTKALKGDSKSQGNWGEVVLERLLERSGLQKDREYRIQASLTADDGKRQLPDVIIDLPEGKNIIIDSKVSISAYERYTSAEDDAAREAALKQHLQSIRAHVKGLGEKNYQNLYEITSLDFVLMFIPIEPAFGLAFQHAPELYNEAFEKNIVIVSPSTLLATLATISSIWKQEYRTRNAIEIARQGGALYDKFVGFVDDMKAIGDRIDKTKDQYDSAMNKLSTGRGNLIKRASEMQKLGVSSTKLLPTELSESVDRDED